MGKEFSFYTDQMRSLRSPAEILTERMQHGLSYPINADEFKVLLQNPLGLLQRIAANRVMEIIIVDIIQFNRFKEELRQLLMEATAESYLLIYDDSDDIAVVEEEELQKELKKMRDDLTRRTEEFDQNLHKYYEALIAYDDYVNDIPDAWHRQHITQVKNLLAPAIDNILRANNMAALDPDIELPILNHVAKPQEILARFEVWERRAVEEAADKPIVMPKPTPQHVAHVAENNLNIALMRILTARENAASIRENQQQGLSIQDIGSADPEQLERVLPSVVKKWEGKGIGQAVMDFTKQCQMDDERLTTGQLQKIKALAKNVDDSSLAPKREPKDLQQLRTELIAITAKLVEQLEAKDALGFLHRLESFYHGDDNSRAITSQKTLALSYKFTKLIEKLPPAEQEKFWANVERHAKSLQANPNLGTMEQRTMFDTLYHLRLELKPQAHRELREEEKNTYKPPRPSPFPKTD